MSSSDDDDTLYDPSQVTNAPAYDTKHLDVLTYRLNEIGECNEKLLDVKQASQGGIDPTLLLGNQTRRSESTNHLRLMLLRHRSGSLPKC